MNWKKFFIPITILVSSTSLLASTASNDVQLQNAIITANSGADTTINITADITLTNAFGAPLLRPLNSTPSFLPVGQLLTINGNGHLFNGANSFRGFFARGGNIQVNNLSFINFRAQGGTSPAGGGGGAGMGASLFVGEGASVTLTNPSFTLSSAIGGAGGGVIGGNPNRGGGGGGNGGNGGMNNQAGQSGSGGGGSLAFNGGNGGVNDGDGAGGGGGVGTNGSTVIGTFTGGNGGNDFDLVSGGGAGGAQDTPGNPGMPGGGGGGAGTAVNINSGMPGGAGGVGGGGGGGATANTEGGVGGAGGDFGGGGGGGTGAAGQIPTSGNGGAGGNGGFGGGGNQNGLGGNGGNGGAGGFGGGGGGGGGGVSFGAGGNSTFGGGSGDSSGFGGGGAGLGGAIFIQNGGTLTIQGFASFSGDSITAGASGGGAATAGSTSGIDIFMQSGAALNFDLTSNVNLPNPIAGNQGLGGGSTTAGGLTKTGPAFLLIPGANTFTGLTTVQAGELRFDNSVVTDVQVQPGGTLTGTFTIRKNAAGTNNGNLTNGGRVSPGTDELGTITMAGDYLNQSTGTFAVGITPAGANGKLFISSGTATLQGGTIEVFVNAGTYINGTQYEVINAPTTGTFAQLVKVGPAADFVVIGISYSSVVLTIINNPLFNLDQFPSSVARAVAECIASAVPFTPGSDFALIVNTLGQLDIDQLNQVLIDLSPVDFGALEWINARNNSYVADILAKHVFSLECTARNCNGGCARNMSLWFAPYGNFMDNTKHYDNLRPFDANAGGIVGGFDYCYGCNYYVGLAAGYTHTNLDWSHHYGNGDINTYYGALYGSYQGSCFDIDFSAIGGGSNQDLKRKISFADVNRTAKSDPWATFFTGHLGLWFNWTSCQFSLEPFGLVDYHHFHRDGFTEHGADSLNLKVEKKNQNMLRGEAGLKFYYTFNNISWRGCVCSCFAPYLGVSWVGEYALHTSKQQSSFIDQTCVIDVNSFDTTVNLLSPQAGLKWTTSDGLSMLIGYKGLFNDKTRINEIEGRLEWVF